ncbi:DUF1501 domain-containing protein [Nocardioides sp. TRM66260-LWL]|uniref:DUF1501 domain-containing protein n=1 Tax=Nocardioides sp. TRM66260-LWL TaxID=2874478 RepID=UPI001CC41035|nr:DUF1501 domain-containing protein [Nocardioides sp. TRM66260-LWL]MBZ5734458.1 DUF1501 domain-containing protein [Nocardioides sp. TRM66260-LWL]
MTSSTPIPGSPVDPVELAASAAPEAACDCPTGGLSRRRVLQGLGAAGVSFTVGSAVVGIASPSAAAVGGGDNVVVVLSLRGGADGLALVVPHGDATYYTARPTLAIPKASLLAPDEMFGLHPALAPLLPMWQAGQVAAVHATGLPVANRSHFAAMEEIEDASPGTSSRTGWLNRVLGTDVDPLRAIAIGDLPSALYGPAPSMSFNRLDDAVIAGDDKWDPTHQRRRAMAMQWRSKGGPMGTAVRSAMTAVSELGPARAAADRRDDFPATDLGRAMAEVSRTIRGNVGAQVITIDQGDWDMHVSAGGVASGAMVDNTAELAGAIAAFFADLGPDAARVTLVTISEFGRRVVENGSGGTDHGWGNVMFLAGAGVKGGRYYGRWPGLAGNLDSDLPVTTDYRSVLAEVVATRTTASTATVFPGFAPQAVGVMTGL